MPLSIYQIPLQKKFLQAEFHPRNNSIIILYSTGELQAVSPGGKESWTLSFDCEPIAFRINATGDLIALLGKRKLYFYNLLTLTTSSINVDEKFQLLEFYKDSVLLSGFQNNIILMKQNGSIGKKIEFNSLIRQFRPVPATDNLIIYNQDHKLLYSDMEGDILWQVENLIIHKEIQISENGYIGYFLLDPNDLLQFNVHGESFFDICDERSIKFFSPSRDGNSILVLDSENELVMFDRSAQKLWKYNFEQNISHIRSSPKGDFFFTVDIDDVLSFYTTDSTDKNREEFFEITDNKRVLNKEVSWTIRPGGYNDAASPGFLTVSPDGTLFGIVGTDGSIYFYDKSCKLKYQTSFTSMVKYIGISNNSQYGYIYGGNEIIIMNLLNDKKKYILFEKKVLGNPVINYHHHMIFSISREKECLIYDFAGHLINTVPLKIEYQKGISCENHGIVLFNEQDIAGYSEAGKAFFNFPIESEITSAFYSEPLLICSTRENVIRMDLSTLKGKKKSFEFKDRGFGIVSKDPLFIVTGEKNLCNLDSNLTIISTYDIQSPDSHFFMEDGRFYEIIKNYSGFFCYNDEREMVWRYSSEDRILESALMSNGLVFSTENSVKYFEIRKKEESNKDFTQYLEI